MARTEPRNTVNRPRRGAGRASAPLLAGQFVSPVTAGRAFPPAGRDGGSALSIPQSIQIGQERQMSSRSNDGNRFGVRRLVAAGDAVSVAVVAACVSDATSGRASS